MHFDHRDVAANTRNWYKSFDETAMTVEVEVACDDEVFEELEESLSKEAYKLIDQETGCVTIRVKFGVCPTCNGKGTHVNPSIDSHGITADEWDRDWSYEDREAYMSGGYDVSCYECHGKRVVPEINRDKYYFTDAIKEIVEIVESGIADEADYVRTCMMERAMGA